MKHEYSGSRKQNQILWKDSIRGVVRQKSPVNSVEEKLENIGQIKI